MTTTPKSTTPKSTPPKSTPKNVKIGAPQNVKVKPKNEPYPTPGNVDWHRCRRCMAFGTNDLGAAAHIPGCQIRPELRPSRDATTPTTTHDDGTFIRTALVVSGDHGSIALVTADGTRGAQVNVFYEASNNDGEECLMVDVIDVDNRYTERRALVFSPTERKSLDVPKGGNLVASHFARHRTFAGGAP